MTISGVASSWFGDYGWPGNIRELRNTLERALIHSDGDELRPEPLLALDGERPRPLREVEEATLRRALAYTRGRQGEAARLLGISRKALWEKRKRFGIP